MKKNIDNQHDYLKLCLVTQLASKSFDEYKQLILSAIRGGVTSVQLREKNLAHEKLLAFALFLKSLLTPLNIPLIINDNVDLAKSIDADGVHLGQSDLSPLIARKILGDQKIIGLSIESMEDLTVANQLDCINYVAASAVFQSKTKLNCKTIWGLEGLKNIVTHSRHPVIAIGGIDADNVTDVIQTGVKGIAVISAIHDHPQPELISSLLRKNHV